MRYYGDSVVNLQVKKAVFNRGVSFIYISFGSAVISDGDKSV